jgi:hypothetical protein
MRLGTPWITVKKNKDNTIPVQAWRDHRHRPSLPPENIPDIYISERLIRLQIYNEAEMNFVKDISRDNIGIRARDLKQSASTD